MKTYGKTELIGDLSKRVEGLTRAQFSQVLDAAIGLIQERVQAGDRVTLQGFGSWQTSARQARKGINPQTKQPLAIPARTGVRFSAGCVFKAAVSERSKA